MIKINLIEKLKTTLFTRTIFYWQAVLVIQFKNCPNLGDCIVLSRGKVYTKPGECAVMYMCVKGINFSSVATTFLLDFACSDCVVFYVFPNYR